MLRVPRIRSQVFRAVGTNRTKCEYPRTIAGFYDRPDHLNVDIRRLSGVSGHLVPNPINKNFLNLKSNGFIVVKRGDCCEEKDVLQTRYIIIDIDSVRHPKKISATEQEHSLALARRDAILGDHPEILQSCVYGSTGNGGWILVRTSKPNTKETKSKILQFLGSLATRYNDSTVEIDTNCANPNRHLPIPGTVKCKRGDHSEKRPWRDSSPLDGGTLDGWL